MPEFSVLGSKSHLPRPGNPESLALGREKWLQAAADAGDPAVESAAIEILETAAEGELLAAIFGHSPFLTQAATHDPAFTLGLARQGPESAMTGLLAAVHNTPANETEDALKRRLRTIKRRAALTIAWADIANLWPLEAVTEALSDLAEATLCEALAFGLRDAARRGGLTLSDADDPASGCGVIVLGMGKLGARELNYSSDIDIIVLFDPEAIDSERPDGLQNVMIRLVRQLVRIMEERTADGYVFRTDLRLRPDPGATPLAISVLAAETYYESLGQNWERAAMIKARPVAGDLNAGARFLEWLTPFIWRKSLDFAAIQDIHSIKRQIDAHRGGDGIKVGGHNVKLGFGGIREIEFFAQTQQLIWGGRIADLRPRRTKDALDALVAFGQCDTQTANELKACYDFLRRVEHRIQMVDDAQTHLVPEEPETLACFAAFLGFADQTAFAETLTACLETVQAHYGALFGDAPDLTAGGGAGGNLVFTGTDPDPDTLETLRGMGFGAPDRVDAQIRAWHHGRYRATRSNRARELLTELLPLLLRAMADTPEPDETFLRFDNFLKALPAGIQLFSMFHSNPHLPCLVVEVIGKAPRLARHMGTNAAVLDSVLTADFFDAPPTLAELSVELEASLRPCHDMEDMLIASRRWANDRRFQVGVLRLRDRITPARASEALSDIAEAALRGMLPRVAATFETAHGRVADGNVAIVALGRLGSREMNAASDLDLIFVYDAPSGAEASDGPRPLAPSQYYARLTQRCINALTALTPEGALYEVDMRLRPSGTKGPIATSLAAFRQYHAESAWTWERMALVRGRVVADTGGLGVKVDAAIAEILATPLDPDRLLRDAAAMRRRLAKEKTTDCLWDVKNLRGGLVDIAFLVQYLCLRHAGDHPDLRHPNTRRCLDNLARKGLLNAEDTARLQAGQDLWTGLLGILALTIEGELTVEKEAQISGALAADLVRVGGALDFDGLKRQVRETAATVVEIFNRLIDEPAAQLPALDDDDAMKELPL